MYFNYVSLGHIPYAYIITRKPIEKLSSIKVQTESVDFLLRKYKRIFNIDGIDYDYTSVNFDNKNDAYNYLKERYTMTHKTADKITTCIINIVSFFATCFSAMVCIEIIKDIL